MRRRIALVTFALGGLATAAASCREPTQVTLVLSTTVPCPELQSGVAITVAASPEAASALLRGSGSVTATTKECGAGGAIGTLVVVPGDTKGAVIVTAGYGAQQTVKCTPDNDFRDCIVARRVFTFVDHTPLTIPIELTPDCVNVPCDTLSTCKNGACVPSTVDCNESGCEGLADTLDGGAPPPDAAPDGAKDASSVDGGLESDPLCGVTSGGPMALQDFRLTNGGLPNRYCIDRREVTQADYAAFLATAPQKPTPTDNRCTKSAYAPVQDAGGQPKLCDEKAYRPTITPNAPVVCVDACDARDYCVAHGKRLCAGDEWPAACQNDHNDFGWTYGKSYDPKACNGADYGAGRTLDVGTLPACRSDGALPLFDMTGNVWEWAEGGGAHGGSFREGDSNRLGCRFALGPTTFANDVGFRCCKSVD